MRFRYSINFRCGIAVFADFFRGIAVLGTPQCPPLITMQDIQPATQTQNSFLVWKVT